MTFFKSLKTQLLVQKCQILKILLSARKVPEKVPEKVPFWGNPSSAGYRDLINSVSIDKARFIVVEPAILKKYHPAK